MKLVIKIVAVLIALVAIAGVGLGMHAESLIKKGVNEHGPGMAGVAVSVDGVSLSVFKGEAGVRGLIIGNPAGYKADHSFSLGEMDIALDPMSVLSDHLVIDRLIIDKPDIIWEVKGRDNNLAALRKSLQSRLGESAESEEEPPTVTIREFVMRDASVTAQGLPVKRDLSLTLPEITLHDIGTAEDGVPYAESANQILKALGPMIAKEASKMGAQEAIEGLKQEGEEAIESLKDEGEEAIESLKDEAEEKLKKKGLGGLLGGSKDSEEDEESGDEPEE